MNVMDIPEDYAIVLQQIAEDGSEDFGNLAESLQLDRKRLLHIVQSLRNKGLVHINMDSQREVWLRLSAKGRRLIAYILPESNFSLTY